MKNLNLSTQLQQYFEQNLPHFLNLLQKMVAVNSFTSNPRGVNELGVQTTDLFAGMGFVADTVQSKNHLYGRHLILTRNGRSTNGKPAPQIGLVSHLDTVFPPDEEMRNDFRWQIDGVRIYGPGVVDIKGGTIMIYMILSAVRAYLPALFEAVTWVVLLDASEESGGWDFGRICVERLRGETLACLIFEPGNWKERQFNIVASRKGMVVYRITVEGKASHAGSAHEQGANAVLQMADVVQHICRLTDYKRQLTYNVGTIAGGTVINRVPHFASASVEMRAFDPEVYAEGIANMLALNKLSTVKTARGDFACRVNVEVVYQVDPWPRNPATQALMHVWQETAVALNFEVIPEDRGGLSDGNYFWQELPVLDGLGPAGGNAHCSERSADGSKEPEYVLLGSFVPKALLNTLAIINLLQGDNKG